MSEWRALLGLPELRRLELGWACSLLGGSASTVAVLVYAYQQGGTLLVGIYALARTLPGAIVTPCLTSLADHVGRERVLRGTLGGRCLLVGVAAAAAATGVAAPVVITLAAASASISATFRPVHAAVLPWLVHTPGQLSAAYIVATVLENMTTMVGPLLAGVMLALAGPVAGMSLAAVFFLLATIAVRQLTIPAKPAAAARHPGRAAAAGITALGRIAPPIGLVLLALAQTFVRGALLVLVVFLAVNRLALGGDAVGWLNAAMGVGGLVGGALATVVVRLARLGRCFLAGIAMWGLPLLALAASPTRLMAFAALLLVGLGNAIEDSAIFTLLPRLLGPHLTGPALGALEPITLIGTAAGSVLAPLFVHVLGLRATLTVLGLMLALLAVVYTPRFATIDHTVRLPGPEYHLLRGLPMFTHLPVATAEYLATVLHPHRYAAGEVVLREGEPGEEFHLVAEGEATVTVGGTEMPRLHRGDGFGEIALLRGMPRSATVTAASPLRTLSVGRADFLAALASSPLSAAGAEALADRRLAAGGSTAERPYLAQADEPHR